MKFFLIAAIIALSPVWPVGAEEVHATKEFDAAELEDRIRGGMLAQVIGNLNGLPHEFKYIDEPGNVVDYVPSLPEGAFTDDDTDIEWVYIRAIARDRRSLLTPNEIADLWKHHINRRIFCANRFARDLMDLGLEPPLTGNVALNPWAEFNISGQFLCESFGLMAPAMPQTASRVGLNYTRVAIDGEPAQTTQLFATMISLAFIESDLDRLLDAGLAAVDLQSDVAGVVRRVREIHAAHPEDWRQARREIRDEWQQHGGEIRDRNGYELNTACTVAALLYGQKDLVETLRIAFNLGWDCDNNAATAATIIGVMKGRRWMNEQDWDIADVYRNTTRDAMPMDETLTSFEDALIQCARVAIEEQGGELVEVNGRHVYRIKTEPAAMVAPLATAESQTAAAREILLPKLKSSQESTSAELAFLAYVALCLGESERLERESPEIWRASLAELEKHPDIVRNLFKAPLPGAESLQAEARRVGLEMPLKPERAE